MKTLEYTIIKSFEHYNAYCNKLEELVSIDEEQYEDEIELLILLIEKYDNENTFFEKLNPIETIKSLMKEHKMNAKKLAEIIELSTGTVSKILNYQKGLSKETIRKLASHFKMQQEAFNRPYKLINYKNESLKNTEKDMNALNYSREYNF